MIRERNTLLEVRGRVSPEPRVHYVRHAFEVPEGASGLTLKLRYRKETLCQLFVSLFGPGGFRGTRMMPGATGDIELNLTVGHRPGPGGLGGEVEPGVWTAQIDIERTAETAEYLLTVEADFDDPEPLAYPQPSAHNGRAGAGWYRGELHAHTHHSDGKASVAGLVAAAKKYGLDFIALTDHFTHAGWEELEALGSPELCVMKGLELTGHFGHANLHGLSEWVNVFPDDPEAAWDISDVAHAARAQGGLFCVNHAFSLDLGWRYQGFDWGLADLYEIYHHLEGPANAAQLTFWDGLLRQGRRVFGVAGTDSHDPHAGRHRLGQVFTHVHAEALSPEGILAGLKAGRAYVSLGPRLDFTAHSGDAEAGMGQELTVQGPVKLRVRLENLAFPARVFVMKNGLHFAWRDVPAGEAVGLEFADDRPGSGYYRLEVYTRDPQPLWFAGREWQNTLTLSNPIFTG